MQEVGEIVQRLQLTRISVKNDASQILLDRYLETHPNGKILLAGFQVQSDEEFEYFVSRRWLAPYDVYSAMLSGKEVREALPELEIPVALPTDFFQFPFSKGPSGCFTWKSPFTFDGDLAHDLWHGGAYWKPSGDGRTEKQFALAFCKAIFEERFAEIEYYRCSDAWTNWFYDVAWDWTAILFDSRLRNLWVLAATDTD